MTIARLRLVFAALALALAIPGALLVRRALESVAFERDARERAVAERVFDEMERALSELLGAEEARPASDYDFASAASPLREQPAQSHALGWFQIEADGSVSAPAWAPRAAALGAEVAQSGARLEAAAAAKPRDRARARRAAPPARDEVAFAQPKAGVPAFAPLAPADAAPLASAKAESNEPAVDGAAEAYAAADALARQARVESAASAEADAYAALAKLNTGAKEREERKQRVYVEQQVAPTAAPEAAELASAQAEQQRALGDAASAEASDARLRSEELVAEAMATAPSPNEWSEPAAELGASSSAGRSSAGALADRAGPPASDVISTRDEAFSVVVGAPVRPATPETKDGVITELVAEAPLGSPPARVRADAELVRVVVDPMRGRLAKSGELLLLRSAWIGARGVRQGVAYDVSRIERALSAAALGDGALPGALLRVSTAVPNAGDGAKPGDLREFSHRFAEPFDALAAELRLPPFADDGARSVYWLAALFSLAGAGGLFAAYRTTAVALHFAERRSNFAAAVSHELKTPLTAIRLYAEMLRDGLVSGDEKRREYYGSITAETERLSRLINNVLEFSRLERGARSLESSVGDVAPVVREAVELLRPHAAAHGLALELALEEALPPVRFERDALLQIVFNLVDNAVKYGRGEPARIEVACKRAGEGVAVVVRDHGPGVPREELARILEPFYRRGDELTRSAPGAGIGLALVRTLAQQMGAALAVGNAERGGLEVSITLPGGAGA